nr:hypothetical protein [uncultured Caldimonas sp.]
MASGIVKGSTSETFERCPSKKERARDCVQPKVPQRELGSIRLLILAVNQAEDEHKNASREGNVCMHGNQRPTVLMMHDNAENDPQDQEDRACPYEISAHDSSLREPA